MSDASSSPCRESWMSDDQWRAACLVADVFGGFHHLRGVKACGVGVRVAIFQSELSTFDFSHLTALVVLAHDRCVRVSVRCAGMKLEVCAFARQREGRMSERHPTLEDGIAVHRQVTA